MLPVLIAGGIVAIDLLMQMNNSAETEESVDFVEMAEAIDNDISTLGREINQPENLSDADKKDWAAIESALNQAKTRISQTDDPAELEALRSSVPVLEGYLLEISAGEYEDGFEEFWDEHLDMWLALEHESQPKQEDGD